jgi:hypothetical protein
LLLALAASTMAGAMAQAYTVYAGETTQLSVVEVQGDTYTWELYNDVTGINFATDPGNCPPSQAFFTGGINTGAIVNVTWLEPGIYFYKVTGERPGCTNNLKVGKIEVLEALPTATIDPPPDICVGDTATLVIHLTGDGPWSLDLFDGTTTVTYNNITDSTFTVQVSPVVATNYTVTRVSDINAENTTPSATVTLFVKPRPVTSPIIQYGP